MVKNATAGRAEWPTSSQRVRRRRDSKVAYHNGSRYLHRNVTAPSTTSASPPLLSSWRPNVQIHQQSALRQPANVDFLNMFDIQSSGEGDSSFDHTPSQQDHAENSWPLSSTGSYTLPTRPPNSPQSLDRISATPTNDPLAEMYDTDLQSSWQTMVPTVGSFNSDPDAMSDSFGSYESFNSLALTINTDASSIPDSFACPDSSSSSASPGQANLQDLYLSGMLLSFIYCSLQVYIFALKTLPSIIVRMFMDPWCNRLNTDSC